MASATHPPTVTPLSIPKGDITLAALLFSPANMEALPPGSKRPVLIIVHPGGGVKEQVASLYATQISSRSSTGTFSTKPSPFLTLVYDASHQGESGGTPRFLEDPNARVSDVHAVVDYISSPDAIFPDGLAVDVENVGVVGICAGGGYAVAAALRDPRIKMVATVNMVNFGNLLRKGWDEQSPPPPPATQSSDTNGTNADEESAEAREESMLEYVPAAALLPDSKHHVDMREAAEYYLTPRGQHPRSENKMLARSVPLLAAWDALEYPEEAEKCPKNGQWSGSGAKCWLVIAGENAGSKWHSQGFMDGLSRWSGIKKGEKFIEMPGASHMDLYDREPYVSQAAGHIVEFFTRHL